jgi:hypothetical protein
VERLLAQFPRDPLPDDCDAQGFVERLEVLIDRGLIGPVTLPGDRRIEDVPESEAVPKCNEERVWEAAVRIYIELYKDVDDRCRVDMTPAYNLSIRHASNLVAAYDAWRALPVSKRSKF